MSEPKWTKYFKPTNGILPPSASSSNPAISSTNRYSSWLPEVYLGPPNRLERYVQYEQMDMDHEVNAALDTLAEFCTQPDVTTGLPFIFNFKSEPSKNEINVLSKVLKQWINLNRLDERLFQIVRSTLEYGDQFFIRDPETYELYWFDPNKVEKIVVNESRGKEISTYFFKDVDLNTQELVSSNMTAKTQAGYGNTSAVFPQAPMGITPTGPYATSAYSSSGRPGNDEAIPVDASHVVHISMTDGLDSSWPFGISILEPIFKIFKQKELLEDAMLIYRIHRAPERRVFYIDIGDMPPSKAQPYLERVKQEVNQKRIPNKTGGGSNIMDSAYNPLSTLEDYFFAQGANGRGSKVDVLQGGQALGDIDDMRYFNNKMFRALGIPSSYLPTGPEDGSASYNDGKVGTAFIQEFRFNERCKRHQRQMIRAFDREFKLYLKHVGVTIDNSMFNLSFSEPQSFSKYREIELESAKVSVYANIAQTPFISKRFALKKWLGLSEEEILENERLWSEENAVTLKDPLKAQPQADLRQVGLSPGDISSADIETTDDMEEIPDLDSSDTDMNDDIADTDISDDEINNFGT